MSAMRLLPVLVVLGSLAVVTPADADPVDTYVRAVLPGTHLPGAALAVVQRGRVVKLAGYGRASLELDAPVTPDTVFELGSISKVFAAQALLLLRDDGKVSLDDPLVKYLDGTPAAWAPITLRHILTHTAGLADFDTGDLGFSYRRDYTGAEFIALLGAQPLTFVPGTKWNYTNAFPLIGLVIERVTGQPYAQFVAERIFRPLGLASARFKTNTGVVPQRADGYYWKEGEYRRGEPLRPQLIAANGGVMMSVRDFAAWDLAVTQGRVLPATTRAEMSVPVRLSDGSTVSHGLGWFVDTFNGQRFGAHWGTTVTGHSSVIRRYDDGLTVIVLGNLDDAGFAVDAISKHVANVYAPGTALEGLLAIADPDAAVTASHRRALAAVAAGRDVPEVVPGLGQRLAASVRERIAAAVTEGVRLETLGEERLTPFHFNLDPLVVSVRRYRARIGPRPRYLTARLAADGTIRGVIVEDPW